MTRRAYLGAMMAIGIPLVAVLLPVPSSARAIDEALDEIVVTARKREESW